MGGSLYETAFLCYYFDMEEKIRFYKLNQSKRYGAEGALIKVSEAVLTAIVLPFFWIAFIAFTVIKFNELFRSAHLTVFFFGFLAVLLVITAAVFYRYCPLYKNRKRARQILKDCTLTEGRLTELSEQKRQHFGTHHSYTYYTVRIVYCFCGLDGKLRQGEFCGNYDKNPFYVGQTLMIAFCEDDSLILNEFTLAEGAEEFARTEAERKQANFTGITGKTIKIDRSQPIKIADYEWRLSRLNAKHKKRLTKILNDRPQFTVGTFFLQKRTYRKRAENDKFYCYLDRSGKQCVAACDGLEKHSDGDPVTVAYSGTLTEIITKFTIIKSRGN